MFNTIVSETVFVFDNFQFNIKNRSLHRETTNLKQSWAAGWLEISQEIRDVKHQAYLRAPRTYQLTELILISHFYSTLCLSCVLRKTIFLFSGESVEFGRHACSPACTESCFILKADFADKYARSSDLRSLLKWVMNSHKIQNVISQIFFSSFIAVWRSTAITVNYVSPFLSSTVNDWINYLAFFNVNVNRSCRNRRNVSDSSETPQPCVKKWFKIFFFFRLMH